jgi:formimidoylglutamate deiminase
VQGIARSGATVAICPTTEANLGDGLFPLRDFLSAGGAFGIGSYSQCSVSRVE